MLLFSLFFCENFYRSGRLHGLVLVFPAEVSLKLKLRPLLDMSVRRKMRSRIPFYFESRDLKVDKISHDKMMMPEHLSTLTTLPRKKMLRRMTRRVGMERK